MSVVERLREAGCTALIRQSGAPLSANWQGYGAPSLVFSQQEIREAAQRGELTLSGIKATITPSILKAEKHAARSAAAKKAAETRRNAPPSRPAVRMLSRTHGCWFEPDTFYERDLCRELFSKGLVLWGEFITPSGRVRRYALTKAGAQMLAKERE